MDLPTSQPALTPEQLHDAWQNWATQAEQIKALRASEMGWRKILANHYFGPTPDEGTTRKALGNGYDLVLSQDMNRKIDEAVLDNLQAQMRKKKIKVDELFPYVPTLSLTQYRLLTADQKELVDQILTETYASPSIELKPTAVAEIPMPPPPPSNIPPPPPPKLVLTDKATSQRLTLEAFYKEGWNEDQLITQGWARFVAADTLEAQEAAAETKPKGRRGRPAGAKNKK